MVSPHCSSGATVKTNWISLVSLRFGGGLLYAITGGSLEVLHHLLIIFSKGPESYNAISLLVMVLGRSPLGIRLKHDPTITE